MLITKIVKVKWNGSNIKWYTEKGYKYEKGHVGKEFEVNVDDLPQTARNTLDICCDKCKQSVKTVSVDDYNKYYKEGYVCKECKAEEKKCVVCNKKDKNNSIYENKYYCSKHLSQLKRHGAILQRSRFDPNEYIIHDTYVEMFLYNKNCEIIDSVFFSLDKLDLVTQYKWSLKKGKNGYKSAITNLNNEHSLSMHRLIMGLNEDDKQTQVDHINGNALDNRNDNLRFCSTIENNRNHTKLDSCNTSGYAGVDFHKASGKWRARVKLNNKDIYLGVFETIDEAIIAREKAELEVYGEFSPRYNELKLKYDKL